MACVWNFVKMYWTISQHLRWDTHPHTYIHTTRTHVRAGTTVSVVLWVIRGKAISFFSRQRCLFCSIDRISGIRASFVILIIWIIQFQFIGTVRCTSSYMWRLAPQMWPDTHPLLGNAKMCTCVCVCVCACVCLDCKNSRLYWFAAHYLYKTIFYELSSVRFNTLHQKPTLCLN
jgi:hypothetical protein